MRLKNCLSNAGHIMIGIRQKKLIRQHANARKITGMTPEPRMEEKVDIGPGFIV